jgi:hypothetical protein
LRQTGYLYYLNNRTDQEDWYGWLGTVVTKYKNIRNVSINSLRAHRTMKNKFVFLRNGGWHFAFQGGLEGAMKKMKEYNHFWYEPEKNLAELEKRVLTNQDYRGRRIKIWKDDSNLPAYLLQNKERYNKLFRP